jgi:predicted nucleic acid-binding protein
MRYSGFSKMARSGSHSLRKLHQKYRDRPMSLADACIVRMAEIYEQHAVLTLDSDFSVYRKHGRVPLALIHPAEA